MWPNPKEQPFHHNTVHHHLVVTWDDEVRLKFLLGICTLSKHNKAVHFIEHNEESRIAVITDGTDVLLSWYKLTHTRIHIVYWQCNGIPATIRKHG